MRSSRPLLQQPVQFDMIGQSYYPFWHGSLGELRTCLTNAAMRYGKPMIVAETAFPWANSPDIYGIPASAGGQVPRQIVAPASAFAWAIAKPNPPSSATPAMKARFPVRSIFSMVVPSVEARS
mgnify:FL=1